MCNFIYNITYIYISLPKRAIAIDERRGKKRREEEERLQGERKRWRMEWREERHAVKYGFTADTYRDVYIASRGRICAGFEEVSSGHRVQRWPAR